MATASSDKTVRLWDITTGQEIRRLEGHKSAVLYVDFSPDGKTIVSAGWDNTARIWDVATGEEVRRLEGHGGTILSLAFSPDGQTIATASADKTGRVWPSVERLLAEAEALIQRAPPEFTPDERTRFGLGE